MAVAEDGLMSKLSVAVVVNKPYLRFKGQTTLSLSKTSIALFPILIEISSKRSGEDDTFCVLSQVFLFETATTLQDKQL